ncbi:MAG: nucleotide exchange factor GrpE [Candidatus Nomurabacteria bacterium]|nr:nucleotide exchange factor GrpE [Candidatus Nomurabacteria bacterium]
MNDEDIIKEEEKDKEFENSSNDLNDPAELDDFEDLKFVDSNEDGDALPTKDIVKKLREDLKTCRKEKEEYLTGWQRAKADYINLQKELDLVRINVSILTKEKMTEKLLPALDSFEMAFSNKEHWEKIDKDWQDGITSIYQQLLSGLEKSGIEKIYEIEVPFNPSIHQSISVVATDDEEKDHTVEKVLQIGYRIGERVIRPAKVTIFEFHKV